MSFPCFSRASTHPYASWPQQAIADSEAPAVLSNNPSVLIVVNWNSVNRFMNFRIELLTNRLDTLNAGVKQCVFKTRRSAAHSFDYRVERSTIFGGIDCSPQILHHG
jgi:hypothetical protein